MFSYGSYFDFEGEDELAQRLKHLRNVYECLKSGLEVENHHVNVQSAAKVVQTPNGPIVKVEVLGLDGAILLFEERKREVEEILRGLKDLSEKVEEVERNINSRTQKILT